MSGVFRSWSNKISEAPLRRRLPGGWAGCTNDKPDLSASCLFLMVSTKVLLGSKVLGTSDTSVYFPLLTDS